jgi:cytochrome c oxidase subunit II
MRHRWTGLAAGFVAVSVLAGACSNDSGAGAAGGYGAPAASSGSDTGTGGRSGYGSDGGSSSSDAGSAAVAGATVTASNYRFAPARITVSAGEVIEVKDSNPTTPHTFTVKGTDIDLSLDPGSSQAATVDLAPGTYQVLCRFHAGQGMKATLVVT